MNTLPSLSVLGNETARDVVCGMSVNRAKTPHKLTHAGESYYFCSAGCVKKFQADPDKYLAHAEAVATSSETAMHVHSHAPQSAQKKPPRQGAGVTYTCPMHPESSRSARARVRSAAWPSNRWTSRRPRKTIPSSMICAAGCGSAWR